MYFQLFLFSLQLLLLTLFFILFYFEKVHHKERLCTCTYVQCIIVLYENVCVSKWSYSFFSLAFFR